MYKNCTAIHLIVLLKCFFKFSRRKCQLILTEVFVMQNQLFLKFNSNTWCSIKRSIYISNDCYLIISHFSKSYIFWFYDFWSDVLLSSKAWISLLQPHKDGKWFNEYITFRICTQPLFWPTSSKTFLFIL